MRQFIVAANWKMNILPSAAMAFMKEFTHDWPRVLDKQVVLFPTYLCWREVREGIRDLPISWGLQNFYPEPNGAFTGEISASMARELDADYLLVGHSERRQYFNESDELLAKKVEAAQRQSMIPMVCVGESFTDFEAGRTAEVICQQLSAALALANWEKPIVIAYEPVWAIGTGKVATPAIAQRCHKILRTHLAEISSPDLANKTSILYGGSVKPINSAELGMQTEIDGFLVGGASLNPETFRKIVTLS